MIGAMGTLSTRPVREIKLEPTERWKRIPGFYNEYAISSFGRVRSIRTGMMKYHTSGGRAPAIQLKHLDNVVFRRIADLVIESFMNNPPKNYKVVYKDGDKNNFKLDNLICVSKEKVSI